MEEKSFSNPKAESCLWIVKITWEKKGSKKNKIVEKKMPWKKNDFLKKKY